jgi:hypothetical protein
MATLGAVAFTAARDGGGARVLVHGGGYDGMTSGSHGVGGSIGCHRSGDIVSAPAGPLAALQFRD